MSLGTLETRDRFPIDTTYKPHNTRITDDGGNASDSDAETLIAKPAAAYTSSPYVFERNPTIMPGPLEELTPPPSPGSGSSTRQKLKKGHKQSPSLNMNFAPLLNRASTVISMARDSSNSSPTRHAAPPTPVETRSSATSTSSGSSSPHRRSKTFADFFQIQGNSAPVSFGLLPTPSPKKEQAPYGSPFGPALEERPESKASSGQASPVRPGQTRRGSTFSAAASFLGLTSPRANSLSPVRKSARSRTRIDDETMKLDFENEIFPNESLGGKGEKAFDELLSNSEKLFNKMRTAYAKKCDALNEIDDWRRADQEDLEEQTLRADNLKQQLDEMAAIVTDRDAEIEDLKQEMKDQERRSRTIRALPDTTDEPPCRIERLWSAGGEDAFEIGEDDDSEEESAPPVQSAVDKAAGVVSRPASARSESIKMQPGQVSRKERTSIAWADAAPFLPPEDQLQKQNQDLKQRVRELEETLHSCLGLVDV